MLGADNTKSMERVSQRLMMVVPVTCSSSCSLIYLEHALGGEDAAIVLLAVPFSAVGAFWLLYLLGYNMSIGGLGRPHRAAGHRCGDRRVHAAVPRPRLREGEARRRTSHAYSALREAIIEGAAKRLRPKFMTFATMSIGLIPILWSAGTGSQIMKRIAAPMVGGIVTSFLLELLVYPAIYAFWRERELNPEADNQLAGGSRSTTSYLELGAIKNRGVVPVSSSE